MRRACAPSPLLTRSLAHSGAGSHCGGGASPRAPAVGGLRASIRPKLVVTRGSRSGETVAASGQPAPNSNPGGRDDRRDALRGRSLPAGGRGRYRRARLRATASAPDGPGDAHGRECAGDAWLGHARHPGDRPRRQPQLGGGTTRGSAGLAATDHRVAEPLRRGAFSVSRGRGRARAREPGLGRGGMGWAGLGWAEVGRAGCARALRSFSRANAMPQLLTEPTLVRGLRRKAPERR